MRQGCVLIDRALGSHTVKPDDGIDNADRASMDVAFTDQEPVGPSPLHEGWLHYEIPGSEYFSDPNISKGYRSEFNRNRVRLG
jgi:hypothetical protein